MFYCSHSSLDEVNNEQLDSQYVVAAIERIPQDALQVSATITTLLIVSSCDGGLHEIGQINALGEYENKPTMEPTPVSELAANQLPLSDAKESSILVLYALLVSKESQVPVTVAPWLIVKSANSEEVRARGSAKLRGWGWRGIF